MQEWEGYADYFAKSKVSHPKLASILIFFLVNYTLSLFRIELEACFSQLQRRLDVPANVSTHYYNIVLRPFPKAAHAFLCDFPPIEPSFR